MVTYGYPNVTYSGLKVTYSYPKVTYSGSKVTYSGPRMYTYPKVTCSDLPLPRTCLTWIFA